MLIKDIITEQKDRHLTKVSQAGAVHAVRFDDLDTYYRMYRFGMAMADHTITHPIGPTNRNAVIVAYSEEEEHIIKQASKQTGHKGVKVADSKSTEPDSTNKQSPVAKPKHNRYGV